MIKLNLGSGGDYINGYINVDLYAENADERFDVAKLPYQDNSIDEIRAYHVIEHFDYLQAHDVLKEWNRVLKSGSKIFIETPDFLESCKEFIKSDQDERWNLYGHFFSTAWINPGLIHKFLYTEFELKKTMTWAGFKHIERKEPNSSYVKHNNKHIFLNVEAIK
jgi:predicted SAM-dependent methyltransferase